MGQTLRQGAAPNKRMFCPGAVATKRVLRGTGVRIFRLRQRMHILSRYYKEASLLASSSEKNLLSNIS